MKVLNILIYIIFISCSFVNNETEMKEIRNGKIYEKDKTQIENCFIANVEYFRKYHRYDMEIYVNSPDSIKREYNKYYNTYPGADRDPANFFEPYASRYSLEKDNYVSSPVPTEDQLKVNVDTIVYSTDRLFCVAFLVIELKYDNLNGFEKFRKEDRRFDGKAIIGYRKSQDNPFQIFPLTKHTVTAFENYSETSNTLKKLYFNNLKGKGSAGSIYEGFRFKQNLGDKDFFAESPYFKRKESGLFYFQEYRYLGKDFPFSYIKCK